MFSERQYSEAWTALLHWTEKQIQRKNPFIIPNFGIIDYCGVQRFKNIDMWRCCIRESFLTNYRCEAGSHCTEISENEFSSTNAIKCHTSAIIHATSFESNKNTT